MALLSLLIIGYCVSFNVERSSRPDYSIAHFPTLIQHAEETQIKINNFQNEISMAYSEQDWKTFYDKTIMTTRKTGGLHCAYKALLLAVLIAH